MGSGTYHPLQNRIRIPKRTGPEIVYLAIALGDCPIGSEVEIAGDASKSRNLGEDVLVELDCMSLREVRGLM